MSARHSDVWTVVVALADEAATPDEAGEFVRAALAAKLDGWQSEDPTALPRWQVANVRTGYRLTGEWPVKRP